MEKELLRQDLVALGLEAGDLVMIHASLRRIGLARTDFGEGGADLLVDALEAALGPAGTLMMVLGTNYAMDWVNERPEAERAGLLAGTPAFDYRNAPVLPEVGWLAKHSGGGRARSPAIIRAAGSGPGARARRRCSRTSPGTIITGRARRSKSSATRAGASCGWGPIPIR